MLIIGTEHCSVKMKQLARPVLVRTVTLGYLACQTGAGRRVPPERHRAAYR